MVFHGGGGPKIVEPLHVRPTIPTVDPTPTPPAPPPEVPVAAPAVVVAPPIESSRSVEPAVAIPTPIKAPSPPPDKPAPIRHVKPPVTVIKVKPRPHVETKQAKPDRPLKEEEPEWNPDSPLLPVRTDKR
jgi:hypothetical protein